MGSAPDRKFFDKERSVVGRAPKGQGGGTMAPMILSDDLYGELEDLVLHTPLAEGAVSGSSGALARRRTPRRADRRHVSGQPSDRLQLGGTIRQREGLDLRARLLDAPRSGRPPLICGIIDPLIEAAFAQDPRELGYQSTVWTTELLVHYLGKPMKSRPPQERELGDHTPPISRWKRPRHQLASRPETSVSKRGLKRGLKIAGAVLLMLGQNDCHGERLRCIPAMVPDRRAMRIP